MQHIIDQLAQSIRDAAARSVPLRIRGGGTKDFYGGPLTGEILDTRSYSGIVDYDPTELVLTARAGTPLCEIEALLRRNRQMLAFEPPRFGPGSTLGGCIASGLSGPRRAYAGSARDHVLGVRVLDGRGTDLRFGGQVIKNVAGYDASRLMAGALGTLGVLLEISLKVLPRPPVEVTLQQECSQPRAIELMNAWAGKPLPISATCHTGERLCVRLSGAEAAVRAAQARLGGETLDDADAFWDALRDQSLPCFAGVREIWRVSLKPTAPPVPSGAPQLIEWNGALRWILGSAEPEVLRDAASRSAGHATLFRALDKRISVFDPLPETLMKLHRRLKETFDPHAVLNRGRLYSNL